MISSIPILMRQRSKDQITELLTLVSMIPCKPEDKMMRQKVLERLLNIDQGENCRVKEGNKARLLLKKKMDDGLLTQKDNSDPVRQLLIRSILANQNWGTIIANNKWGKLFVQNYDVWSLYEQWIVFLCFQGFQKDKAKFLSSNIIKRSNKIMKNQIYGFKTNYYRNKFKKWISKDVSQLKKVHYEIERNLFISIKLGESFQETAERLDLEEILKTCDNPLENDRNDWILFLCTKFEDNYPMKKPDFDSGKQQFTWIQQKINNRYKINDFQKKLSAILNQYATFQDYFTNELQASLLSDIKQRSSWKTAQNHINQLFLMNSTIQKKQAKVIPKNSKNNMQRSNDENQNTINSIQTQSSSVYLQGNWDSNSKYSFPSKDTSQQSSLISSLPIILFERSKDKVRDLFIMASLIEHRTAEQKFIKQKFLERTLNYNHPDKYNSNKKQFEAIQKKIQRQMAQRETPLENIQDPVQRFLVGAIVRRQSWGDLIARNKWGKVFHTNHDTWSLYDQWIIFLCFQGFTKEQARFLSSSLTKRSNTVIMGQLTGFKTSYYVRKFKKWMSKSVGELELVHYEMQRNLLIAIKQGLDIYKTARRLNVQQILQSTVNPIENQRNDWLLFLVTQFEDNYPIKKPDFNKETQQIQWSEIQINVKYKVTEYRQKLEYILGRYTNFFLFFTNELEASLLSDIKQKNSWQLAKKHIEQLFHYNAADQRHSASSNYQETVKTQKMEDQTVNSGQDLAEDSLSRNTVFVNFKEEDDYSASNKQTSMSKDNDRSKQMCKVDSKTQFSSKIAITSPSNDTRDLGRNSFAKIPQNNYESSKISQDLVFPTDKCQIFSAINKCKQSSNYLDRSFRQTDKHSLRRDESHSKEMVQPIYQSLLKKYIDNPEILKRMGNQDIKTFLEITLSANLKHMDNLVLGDANQEQECFEDDYDDICQQDLNKSFISGFDELVSRVKSKDTPQTKLR